MKRLLTHLLAFAIGVVAAIFCRPNTDRDETVTANQTLPGKSDVVMRGSSSAARTSVRPKEEKQSIGIEISKSIGRADLDSWLESKKGDSRYHAEALVTVGLLTDDPDLIRQGIQTDPENRHLLFIGTTFPAFSDEERLAMSKRLLAAAPDNALAAYISAAYLSESGQPDAAMQILKGSSARPKTDDFRMATQLMTEEALIATGLSPDAAKIKSSFDTRVGYLSNLNSFVKSLKGLESSLSPDEASELRSLTASMGQRMRDQSRFGTLIDHLNGMAMEEAALGGLPNEAPSPYEGLTVSEARESIVAERQELRQAMNHMPDMNDLLINNPDLMSRYIDRVRLMGELDAVKWLNSTTPE